MSIPLIDTLEPDSSGAGRPATIHREAKAEDKTATRRNRSGDVFVRRASSFAGLVSVDVGVAQGEISHLTVDGCHLDERRDRWPRPNDDRFCHRGSRRALPVCARVPRLKSGKRKRNILIGSRKGRHRCRVSKAYTYGIFRMALVVVNSERLPAPGE